MPDDISRDVLLVRDIDAIPAILDVVCRTTNMGFAAVARVTTKQWVACAVLDRIGFGLEPGGELPVETTLCHDVRAARTPIIIDNVAEDPDFANHDTPRIYGLQSYVSVPIVLADGSFFGTLCAIDPHPSQLKASGALQMFTLFAELIGFHIDSRMRLHNAETSLASEQETAQLRDRFIAILGHDLRNPLASINSGVRLLSRAPLDERSKGILGLIQGSVVRMGGLIDNVLDYARGTLDGGLELSARQSVDIEPALQQVIDEMQMAHPDRRFEAHLTLAGTISCDPPRIAQLLSNLLSNALNHGTAGGLVRIFATSSRGDFTLAVANPAPPLPEEFKQRLFKPFSRVADGSSSSKGLGLGLYISSQIAQAHGGRLEFSEAAGETIFTFSMNGGQTAGERRG